jgi:hypothetical protein
MTSNQTREINIKLLDLRIYKKKKKKKKKVLCVDSQNNQFLRVTSEFEQRRRCDRQANLKEKEMDSYLGVTDFIYFSLPF